MTHEETDKEPQRKGREGARWINERPSPEEFAEWVKDNVKIDDALNIKDYVGGIVLIPAVDKRSKYVASWTPQGEPVIKDRPEMVYVPYPKVETRLQYLWDLLEKHDDWTAVVQPIATRRPSIEAVSESILTDAVPQTEDTAAAPGSSREIFKPSAVAAIVHQLPPGFFIMPVPMGDKYSYFLCCSYRVAIYKTLEDGSRSEHPLREGRGTKQVTLLVKKYRDSDIEVDENAIMKAETGAIGRALGAAGIFTIPGSGIATAEDMLEAAAAGSPAASGEPEGAGPEAPAQTPGPAQPTQGDENSAVLINAKAILLDLQEHYSEAYNAFGEWCNKRRPRITSLEELEPAALRGVHTKLQNLLAEAKRARMHAPAEPEETQDAPVAPGKASGGDEASLV